MGCRRPPPPPHATVITCTHQKRKEMIYNTHIYQFNMNVSLYGNTF